MGFTFHKRKLKKFLKNELQLVFFSLLTGVFSGVTVTIYNVFMHYAEEYSVAWYEALLVNPALIPLLFVALAIGAIVIGTVLKFVPLARGSGVPQAEGAIRGGIVVTKWFRLLTTSFALSLATAFLGMTSGGEGPSMLIGGMSGEGVASMTKRNKRFARYLVTGGASSGLAVAANAPLMGFLFAFEEAHKKFTPEIFLTAFFSVVSGVFTRSGLHLLFGLIDPSITISPTLHNFDLTTVTNFTDLGGMIGVVIISAIVVGLLGVGFYYAVVALRPLFAKMTFFKGTGKFLIPFLLAGAFGLISVYEMGNGHSIIESLGTNGGVNAFSLSLNFASPLIVSLVVVLVMKFIASVLNMGAGVPCGVFIPMLSVGACAGGLISYVASTCGMNPAYSDIIVMICMATFFATIVKAPLTSIVMVFELTGSYNFTLLLPVMLGVAIGYFIGRLCSTHAIYDVILEGFIESDGVAKKGIKERFVMTVESASPADDSEVHDLLLPWATAIIAIKRDGRDNISPSAETILNVGDELTIEAETDDREATEKELLAVTSGEE